MKAATATMVVGGLLAAMAPAARAQDTSALVRTLFDAAVAQMEQKNYAAACPKLEEAQKLQAAVGVELQLARCYDGAGRVASAWARYKVVAEKTRSATDDTNKLRFTEAQDRLAALTPKVPYLTITAPAPAPEGLEIRLDGVVLPALTWGTAIPVDPGAHALIAKATGRKEWRGSAEAQLGAKGQVAIPPLEADAVPPAAVAPVAPPPSTAPEAPARVPTWAWVSGGLGLVALGVGAGFGGSALKQQSSIEAPNTCPEFPHCPMDMATKTKVNGLVDTRNLDRNVFTGLAVAGVVGIGAAVIGIATRKPEAVKTGFVVAPFGSAEGGGVEVKGTF